MKTIMAIGAHIGDMELTCGGVLCTMALEGAKIVTVALTAGEKGTTGDIELYKKQKISEAKRFAEALGGESVVLNYPDGLLHVTEEVKWEVADLIRKYKPSILITHHRKSMHKDHEACHLIVKDAQFYAGLKGFKRELEAHYANGPYYAENWEDPVDFRPYVYVKVSKEGYEKWRELISIHKFTVESPSFKYKEYYEALKIVRGKEARLDYAEAFNIDELKKRIIRETL
ncbi:MAG: PIG-L family deacetylase [Acholeplasmataceae bacterium]|jgi:LmbE family N-acetylglucosaminyl deacetylase|nr:PIG-L family deacetylase [Acholeplasmataceae bacterium]